MKTIMQSIVSVLLLAGVLVAPAQTVPVMVNYQGRLSNPDGTALATGDYTLTFRVFDSTTNSSGLVWGPQVFDGVPGQGHGSRIPLVQGYFNVMLGPVDTNGVLLADSFNASNRFVEITVGNRPPILPRQQILSAPYAINSAKLAGHDWSTVFGTNDPVNGKIPITKLATNGMISAEQIRVNSTSSQGALNVNGGVAIEHGQELQLNSLDNSVAARIKNPANNTREIGFVTGAPLAEAMRINQAGFVGIGTTNPSSLLHVAGDVRVGGGAGNGGIGAATRRLTIDNDVAAPSTHANLSILVADGTAGDPFVNFGIGGPTRAWGIGIDNGDADKLKFVTKATASGLAHLGDGTAVLTIDTSGNVGIGTTTPSSALQVVGTVTATAFNPPSDRNLKENFRPVSPRDVLDKMANIPISRWNFKGDSATPHIGPMAQDFHAAFGLGTDERHIATVDADGVALAAIQGLNQKLEEKLKEKDGEIELLKERLRRLEDKSDANSERE